MIFSLLTFAFYVACFVGFVFLIHHLLLKVGIDTNGAVTMGETRQYHADNRDDYQNVMLDDELNNIVVGDDGLTDWERGFYNGDY